VKIKAAVSYQRSALSKMVKTQADRHSGGSRNPVFLGQL